MLKAINIFKIHQNLFKYWFTLSHFALDDPVVLETIYVVNKEILQKNPRFIIKSGFKSRVDNNGACTVNTLPLNRHHMYSPKLEDWLSFFWN